MKAKPLLIATFVSCMITAPSKAAVIYWDGGTSSIVTNGDGISQGGSGTWDATIKNWDQGSGLAHTAWNKRFSAHFAGSAGTVTLATAITTLGLSFDSDGYSLIGNGLMTLKSAGITANGNTSIAIPLRLGTAQSWTVATGKTLTVSGTLDTSGRNLTLTGAGNTSMSGIISGTGGLTKSGSGLLKLTGANLYSGITTIAGGILNLDAAEVSGTSGSGPLGKPTTALGSILFTGGTLQYSAVNNADYSNRFSNLGGQSWNIDTNGRDVTYGSNLAGTGSTLLKIGTGTLNLTGISTYNGGTTITSGVLNVTGGLADTGAVTVSGGTYTIGVNDTIGTLSLLNGVVNGGLSLTATSFAVQNGTISAALAGAGSLTKTTTGTVNLSGANTYTGGTTVSAGVLNVTGTLSNLGFVRVSGGTYTVGANDTIGALTLASGTINGSGMLTGSSYVVESGTISANLNGPSIALTKNTGGTVTLSGTNAYTGATTINAGTLVLNGSLSSNSSVSLAAGAILSGIGTAAGTVTVSNNPTTTVIAGNGVSGTLTLGGLNFLGAGTIQIGALSNYTNTAALNVTGSMILGGGIGGVAISLPVGTVSEGTYHLINNPFADLTKFSVTGATLGNRQVSQLVNNGSFIDYVVSGTNPYWTGSLNTEWSTAILAAPKNWALTPTQTTDFITNDAVIFDDRASSTIVNISANVSPNVVSFSNSTKDYTLQGAGGITTGSLTKSGTGTLTILNANSYSGTTTLASGFMRIGSDSSLGSGTLALTGGTLTSNSTASRTLSNAIAIGGDIGLGDLASNGALNFTGPVTIGGTSRQLTTSSAVTMSGVISGGGIVKAGEGSLTLSGANTYSGGTVILGGTIAITDPNSLGAASGAVTFAGDSSLQFLSALTTVNRYVINSGITASIDTTGFNITQSEPISGNGILSKTGSGTLTLAGLNTYTGATIINNGTLALSGGAAIVDTGAVTLSSNLGATLRLNSSETIGSLAGNGTVNLLGNTLTVANTTETIFSGAFTGTGNLTKTGNGTFVLSGDNSHTGVTTINAGTLKVSSDNAFGGVPSSASPGKLILGGGTLATTGSFTLDSNRGIVTGGTIDVAIGTILSYGGIAAGTGSLIKNGPGSFVLSGTNTYSGPTLVNNGTLFVNGSTAVTSSVSVASNAILAGTGTVIGNVTAEDSATLRAGNGVSGSLSLSGNLNFTGDALIQIGALNHYTNTPAIHLSGSLTNLDTASIIFSLPTGLLANGTYHLMGHSNNLNSNAFKAYSVTGPTVGDRQFASLKNNPGVIDYVISGDSPYWTGLSGSEWNTTNSNWKLINAGTDTVFMTNDAVLFNDNATGTTIVNIASSVDPVVVSFNNSVKNYTIQGASGITSGSLTKTGTGTLTITNSNSYNGGTTLSSGTIQVGNANALGTAAVNINGGTISSDSTISKTISNSIVLGGNVDFGSATQTGQLTFSGNMDLGGATRQINHPSDVTISGSISNGGLTKTGVGTMTISGASTYSGSTNVTAGKLLVSGSLMSASTTIGNGAILAGQGTLGGFTTIQSGGIHSPGANLGIQTFTDLTYSDGAVLSWEINTTLTQTRGIGYDALNVLGAVAGIDGPDLGLNSDAIFRIVIGDGSFSDTFWNTARVWNDIFTTANGSTIKENWAPVFGGGFQFYNSSGDSISAPTVGSFSLTGNTLAWSVVPEPSVLPLFSLAVGLIWRRRR